VSTAAEAGPAHRREATRIRPQHGRAVDTGAHVSRGTEPSSSDDDGGLSDSDSEPSSDDDGWLSEAEQGPSSTRKQSEAEQGPSSTRKQSRWSSLDEQRLLAYRKEGKPWPWIFRKFPGRTHPQSVRAGT
jgi:hypothetical protein